MTVNGLVYVVSRWIQLERTERWKSWDWCSILQDEAGG